MIARPQSKCSEPHKPGETSKRPRDASAKPVQRRLLVPLTSVLLLLAGGFGAALIDMQQTNLSKSSQEKLAAASFDLEEGLAGHSQILSALEMVLLSDPDLIDAIKTQDRDRLLAFGEPILKRFRAEHGITHFYVHRPDRVNLLHVHKPEKNGDLINRVTLREAERTGRQFSSIELGTLGTFTLRVVQPVFDGGELIGYLELGKEIEDILEDIAEEHGIEMAISIHKKALKRELWEAGMKMLGREGNWNRFSHEVLIYASLPRFPSEAECFVDESYHVHGDSIAEIPLNGKIWRMLFSPLTDASGIEVGDLIVFHDTSEAVARFNRLLVVSAGGTLALLAMLIGSLYVALRRVDRSILARSAELKNSMTRFNQLAEQSNTIAWEVNGDGLFTYVSHVAEQVLGYRREELVGRKHFYDLHPQDGREGFRSAAMAVIEKRGRFSGVENTLQTKQGGILWITTLGLPHLDADGNFLGYRGSYTDITQQKRVEEALHKSNKELVKALEREKSAAMELEAAMEQLKASKQDAENANAELAERLDEVEAFNRLAIGRELRMIELKQEINSLLRKQGKPAEYEIAQAEAST